VGWRIEVLIEGLLAAERPVALVALVYRSVGWGRLVGNISLAINILININIDLDGNININLINQYLAINIT
jgi:hypothetical protein